MTGYASEAFRVDPTPFALEIRSVNSRHADVRVKLPWSAPRVEAALSARVRKAYQRGRVDVLIRAAPEADPRGGEDATLDQMVQAYRRLERLSERLDLGPPSLQELLTHLAARDSLQRGDRQPPEGLESAALESLDRALGSWDDMRRQEGARMVAAIRELLGEAREHLGAIESLAELQPTRLGEKVRSRVEAALEELGAAPDTVEAARLTGEIALLAERADVTEEMVRLRSHFDQFERVLAEPAPHGRKLDFILQEMHRETNTTGAKAPDGRMSALVVEVKAQLEKVREIVQNIE